MDVATILVTGNAGRDAGRVMLKRQGGSDQGAMVGAYEGYDRKAFAEGGRLPTIAGLLLAKVKQSAVDRSVLRREHRKTGVKVPTRTETSFELIKKVGVLDQPRLFLPVKRTDPPCCALQPKRWVTLGASATENSCTLLCADEMCDRNFQQIGRWSNRLNRCIGASGQPVSSHSHDFRIR